MRAVGFKTFWLPYGCLHIARVYTHWFFVHIGVTNSNCVGRGYEKSVIAFAGT